MYVGIRRLAARLAILLGLALAVGMLIAPASTPVAAQGTPEQRAACENDAMRVCGQYVPDVGLITACMKRNCRSLSSRCRTAMRCGKRGRR
jgi:hypothetical protein